MKENEPSSFSFSFDSRDIDPESLKEKIRNGLQEILDSQFSESEKRRIAEKTGRLNFACPYCGDSYNALHKKRGNFYFENYAFHCYNCGKHNSVRGLFNDFSKSLDADEIVYIQTHQKDRSSSVKSIDPFLFLDKEAIENVSIERRALDAFYRAVPIDNSRIFWYLKKRLQSDFKKFSWDAVRERLFIYHCIPGKDRVLGFQVRNFKSNPKYMTWNLSRIYEDMELSPTPESIEIDKISTTFGILELDFKKPITVFEGPLDSFLFRNSVATCSVARDFPLEMGNLRYMYDYDVPGRDAAMNKLEKGYPVFLWKRYLQDAGIPHNNKKIDLTDLLIYAKRKGVNLPRFGDYFSSNKYDAYWI
jgi:predicted RNA-binding Zn-ribbon protein involved in translation (DUF1610 family)